MSPNPTWHFGTRNNQWVQCALDLRNSLIETSFAEQKATTSELFVFLISIRALRNLVWLNIVSLSVILPTFQDILPRKQIRSKY